jgi:uncharacterized protein (TIGR00730 family)
VTDRQPLPSVEREAMQSRPMTEIAVLGSARIEPPDPRWALAHRLGELLARRGFAVVTGGYGGLMSAVSQGVSESGGRVIGLPMRHWDRLEPNRWNAELRWSDGYGTRLAHLLRCTGVVALPGGVGTLSEMAVIWAAAQTEPNAPSIVLLGDGWAHLIEAIGEHLVVGPNDLKLLQLVDSPDEAVQALTVTIDPGPPPGPRG